MASLKPKKVLIVDDNVDAAELVAELFRTNGHFVDVACGGYAAIRKALDFRPEVIFLELDLADLDGFQVVTVLRPLPIFSTCTIIAYTTCRSIEIREKTQAYGFDACISKRRRSKSLLKILAPKH